MPPFPISGGLSLLGCLAKALGRWRADRQPVCPQSSAPCLRLGAAAGRAVRGCGLQEFGACGMETRIGVGFYSELNFLALGGTSSLLWPQVVFYRSKPPTCAAVFLFLGRWK